MDGENVISLRSGKPIVKEIAEKTAAAEEMKTGMKAAMLEALDAIHTLVETDALSGFILVGRAPTGAFLTEVALPYVASTEHVLSYIGAIECVKLELTDLGQMMPQMLLDGTIVAAEEMEEDYV